MTRITKLKIGNKAFTLLELLLVIAIIAVLAGIISFSLKPADRLQQANQIKYLSNASDIEKAINSFVVDNDGNFPVSFSSLTYGYYDICKQGQSGECVSLDALVPLYLPTVPYDTENVTATTTGFRVRYDSSKKEAIVYSNSEYTSRIESGITLTEGLVGWWKMDESSWNGTAGEVKDSSGTNNHGTATNGAIPVLGLFGNAGSFDGSNDYISLQNYPSLKISGDITLSAWIKTADMNNGGIFERYTTGQSGYRLVLNSSSGNTFMSLNTSSGFNQTYYGGMNNNSWHHIVGVYDGMYIRIYTDGVLRSSVVHTGTIVNQDIVGRMGWSDDNGYLSGLIDEVRIYNRALNLEEVGALYAWAPGPSIYLPLDEGSGSVISDKSGNNWPITASSSPIWVQGKYGSAINLNSTNFLYTTYFDYKKAFTQTAWIYLTSLTGADQGVFGQYESYTTNKGMHHTLRNSQPYMGFYGNDLGSAISLVTGRWYHIAYVFDGNNRSIYLGGLRIAGPTASVPYNGLVGNTVFGASYNGSSPLRGYLDEVRVYNYARTPEQIVRDMNNL